MRNHAAVRAFGGGFDDHRFDDTMAAT